VVQAGEEEMKKESAKEEKEEIKVEKRETKEETKKEVETIEIRSVPEKVISDHQVSIKVDEMRAKKKKQNLKKKKKAIL